MDLIDCSTVLLNPPDMVQLCTCCHVNPIRPKARQYKQRTLCAACFKESRHLERKRHYGRHREQERQRHERRREAKRLARPPKVIITPAVSDALVRRRLLSPYSRKPCVYVVQLLERTCVLKIGRTRDIFKRLNALQREYGRIHCLMVILHENPRLLERVLHTRFKAFRIYEGAKQSELFISHTRAAKKAFDQLYRQYPSAVIARPQEDARGDTQDETRDQMALFA